MTETDTIEYNGTWEKPNRSIIAAAVTGVIGIGAIYFNLESILITILTVIYKAVYHIELSGGMAAKIRETSVYLKTPILIAVSISEFVFMLLPTIWIIKKWHTTEVIKYIRIKFTTVREIVLAMLVTVFIFPFSSFLVDILVKALGIPKVILDANSMLFTPNSNSEFILMIYAIAVTPAICEEILFRGYFQRTLERKTGMKSFIITGILFGLFHMQPLTLISLSMLGILLSYFYYRSQSILPSSAAHFTNNFLAILLLFLKQKGRANNTFENNISIGWVILSLLISAGLFLIYLKITKVKPVHVIEDGRIAM